MPKRHTTTTTSSSSSIPSTFTDALPLPTLLVFDLDYTLWPFWVDTHVTTPIKPNSCSTGMLDRHNETFTFYNDIPSILSAASAQNITMGLASRTSAPDLAEKMLRGIQVDSRRAWDFFTYREIFPGSKIKHFRNIQRDTVRKGGGEEVAFEDMLFFDDERRNREVETQLGVTFWLVRDGVSCEEIDRGVREWRRRRGIGTEMEKKVEA